MQFNLELFLVLAVGISGLMLIVQRWMHRKTGFLYSVVETVASLFVVFLLVLLIRSFIVEPFRIPSGSMIPTLQTGDFILVNKYQYGLRLPVIRTKFLNWDEPQRGDVAVFKYPRNPKHDFIKRIIGLPGDDISYHDKAVRINDQEIRRTLIADDGRQQRYSEEMSDGVRHDIVLQEDKRYSGFADWKVPAGHYFVMGDNRDNSNDSRSWGFVPETHLVGRAFFIWLNWDWDQGTADFSRAGTLIE